MAYRADSIYPASHTMSRLPFAKLTMSLVFYRKFIVVHVYKDIVNLIINIVSRNGPNAIISRQVSPIAIRTTTTTKTRDSKGRQC